MRAASTAFIAALLLGSVAGFSSVIAETAPTKDQVALFATVKGEGKTGIARKTKPVDARAAVPGEVIVTVIKGEGVETKSKPAEAGDWVVRNRCPETGNEEILVKAAKFPTRYGETQSKPDAKGYRAFSPKGSDMGYFIVPQEMGEFTFTAPWGEAMVARPGDAIVQVPDDVSDTYRIAAASFACTYEIVTPAKP
ncbi:hypothetical protein G6N74_06600 [Mesorhizobium sp. CGMCC 1.15528]|uniref:DUF4198 domain-containing protein n=1 Tax=Mesorhizobium zhangyense TaxID=1776730 RepID=A0A7C9VBU8_9HYPH|nr:hypothetical protein [Mesorhizobium zhangyense]NGN40728.1 hypothetical protein [Mesorhizobium zhangyense]